VLSMCGSLPPSAILSLHMTLLQSLPSVSWVSKNHFSSISVMASNRNYKMHCI
jgi:hypothetical protein